MTSGDARPALAGCDGTYTYGDLDAASRRVAGGLLDGADDLGEARVAFLVRPSCAYAAVQRGIWRAGGVAVPLAVSDPPAELDYVIRDAAASCVVADPSICAEMPALAQAAGVRMLTVEQALASPPAEHLPHIGAPRRGMIVYTSGTTGRPKGVVTTHSNIGAQIAALVEAWGWSPSDRLLLTLPLHHVHGIINGLGSALAVRATCEILPAFDAEIVWDRLASGEITVFTAVPTIYHRLVASWDAAPPDLQRRRSEGVRRLRLMMSGSAALPVGTLERWRAITEHTLLERYGMTEIGMALANPLEGERRPGFVGTPLPGVEVRIVDDAGRVAADGEPGELEVRGPTVFKEYWQRPDETRAAFRDGWFRTGDVAVLERGSYRLLGRTSVDIIKTGGFKVSALEIEEVLRTHPGIAECAVVGVDDPEWGERVSAAIELRPGAALALRDLQEWARSRLAPYKIPRAVCAVAALPRNAMGKVVKPDVAALFTV
ncbi:MAG TPA: acyl-CoA synthetase [Vicinamibacterales bacterium]|nr:acyl-CoA synthetase [Vicinamibacterales bacterium]